MPLSPLESAIKLQRRYHLMIEGDRLDDQLLMLNSCIGEENPEAKRCFERMCAIDYVNHDSKVTLSQLMALVFLALHDRNNRSDDLNNPIEKLVQVFTEIQQAHPEEPLDLELAFFAFNELIQKLAGTHLDFIESPIEVPELENKIIEFEGKKELSTANRFFHNKYDPNHIQRVVNKLLLETMHGNQEKIENLFAASPISIRHIAARTNKSGPKKYVTDFSGRKPENCSPFMYALWAMDAHMLKMMLESLHKAFNEAVEKKDDAGMKECEEIRQELVRQYIEITQHGLNYTDTHSFGLKNETHFNFQPLLDALRTYIEEFEFWDSGQREQYWCQEVGGQQQGVPAHVAQEYSHPNRSFYLADANEPKLRSLFKLGDARFPRSLVFCIYLRHGGRRPGRWWDSDVGSRLGFDFGTIRADKDAVCRGRGASAVAIESALGQHVKIDLAALTALCEVRSQDMVNLEQKLLNLFQTQTQEASLQFGMSRR